MLFNNLAQCVTGRETDFFAEDIRDRRDDLLNAIQNKRILVIGGAGSIGSSTVKAILPFKPSTLHVVDQNENGLAELIRDIRSSQIDVKSIDLQTLPLDFGSPVMRRFLLTEPPYDYVLNFAAIKHVRSEKDIFSLLQLLDTNLVKSTRLLEWLAESNAPLRYFCVSTDKAANPVNFMGASKRLMERLIFSGEIAPSNARTVSSARFANVAFSQGSLLESFLVRIQKQQPLAAPENTRRFFISLNESGQICLLAAFLASDKHTLIPRLSPEEDLILLEDVASGVLERHGFQAKIYRDESEAKRNLPGDVANKEYPLVLTPLDTSGEKAFEEFAGEGETVTDVGLKSALSIPYQDTLPGSMSDFLNEVVRAINEPSDPIDKEKIKASIASLVPQFHHIETHRNLDQRM